MPKVNEKFYSEYFKLLGEVLVSIFGHGLPENIYHSEKRGPSKRKIRNKRRQYSHTPIILNYLLCDRQAVING